MEFINAMENPALVPGFPLWVRNLGKTLRDQILTPEASSAFGARDTYFIQGFVAGLALTAHHLAKQPSGKEPGIALWLSEGQWSTIPSFKQNGAGEVFDSLKGTSILANTELHPHILGFITDLGDHAVEDRTRIIEGIREGSKIESIIEMGGHRIGTAFDIQFQMLLFWPEFEAARSRRAAFEMLVGIFAELHKANQLGDWDRFEKFAKRCQYKSRAANV